MADNNNCNPAHFSNIREFAKQSLILKENVIMYKDAECHTQLKVLEPTEVATVNEVFANKLRNNTIKSFLHNFSLIGSKATCQRTL